MDEKKTALKKALEDNDSFLAFLKQEVRSDEYQQSKKRAEEGPHPTEDMLYDYASDDLDRKDAKMVRDHISLCGICAKEVLLIRDIQAESETSLLERADTPVWVEGVRHFTSSLSSVCDEFREMLSFSPQSFWAYSVSRFSMVAVCLLVFSTTASIYKRLTIPKLGTLIAESYQPDLICEIMSDNKMGILSQNRSDRHLSFASPTRHGPGFRAFGAGLWSGRQELGLEPGISMPEFLSPKWQGNSSMNADTWMETSYSNYFWLGWWGVLLQAVCLSGTDVSSDFWEQQLRILDKIQEKFEAQSKEDKKKGDKIVMKTLERVQSALKALDQNSGSKKQRKTIAFQFDHLITYLSPK